MRIPPYLKKGDQIGLTCTARGMTTEDLQGIIGLIEAQGFKAVLGDTVGKTHHQFGGKDSERALDFQKMLNNPAIKAIWICRGGYGTIRILDQIDFSAFMQNPKWIVGYSDVTILHTQINNVMGVASLHALMPIDKSPTKEALGSVFKALKGEVLDYNFKEENSQKCDLKGEVIGGNLSILYSLLGTNTVFNTEGKILFLEDIDEYLYHIDRMMISLKRAGKLKNLAALLVGGMTDMNDNTIPFGKNTKEIILEHTKEYNYPVIFDFPSGHIPDNRAIVFGKEMAIVCANNKVQTNQ